MSVFWRAHPLFGHVALCDGARGLAAIHQPHINLVIWERAIPEELLRTIGDAPLEQLPNVSWRDRQWWTGPRWHRELYDRLDGMAHAYAAISDIKRFSTTVFMSAYEKLAMEQRMSVEAFHTDGDAVIYRMFVVLRGPRFEWLPDNARRRTVTVRYSPSFAASHKAVQTVPLGAAVLFKGQGSFCRQPLIHRGPRHWIGVRFTVRIGY